MEEKKINISQLTIKSNLEEINKFNLTLELDVLNQQLQFKSKKDEF